MRKRYRRLVREFTETITMTLVVFLFLITFVVQGYKVYGSCMEPNLQTGERLIGNKFIYHFEKPTRGDVIVFKYPPNPNKVFVKRIIGLPGETVEIRKGKVYLNGRALDEDLYVVNAAHGDFGPQKIPDGCIFVLGDNRDESNDSRFWGDLPLRNVQAKAWLRYWPLSRIALFQ